MPQGLWQLSLLSSQKCPSQPSTCSSNNTPVFNISRFRSSCCCCFCLSVPWLLCCWIDMLVFRFPDFPQLSSTLFLPPSLSFRYMGSAAIFGIYGTRRKFVFASSHSKDAVIAATHGEKAPEDRWTLVLEVAFPPVEMKVIWVGLKTTSPGASTCFWLHIIRLDHILPTQK